MNDMMKLSQQDVAEKVLQVYTKALQDRKQISNILSEYCILDYFGNIFCKKEEIASHLFTTFHVSVYELESLSINDTHANIVEWEPLYKVYKSNSEDDLGVGLISSPKSSFPSVALSTPVRRFSPASRKHMLLDTCQAFSNCKIMKTTHQSEEQGSSNKKNYDAEQKLLLSPQSFQTMLPEDLKYLTAYVTIKNSNVFLSSHDPKHKHTSLLRLRKRFCQLKIGFECDEHLIGVTNCKIWTIKYSVSSRVTPRNLLTAFNEVE